MGQFVKEKAHLNIDQKAYGESYDRIFGRKDKPLHVETSDEEESTPERQVQRIQLQEESSTI